MKFTLEIELGNDAMQSPEHVAYALRKVADRIDSGVEDGPILDLNGNTVGGYDVVDEKSAYDLVAKVNEHADAVWATVFTWDDVDDRIAELLDDVDPAERRRVKLRLQNSVRELAKAIERACMGGGDWHEAIDEQIREASNGSN